MCMWSKKKKSSFGGKERENERDGGWEGVGRKDKERE